MDIQKLEAGDPLNLGSALCDEGVSETGWKSIRIAAVEYFGISTMEVVLKHAGTAAWASDRLNMSV